MKICTKCNLEYEEIAKYQQNRPYCITCLRIIVKNNQKRWADKNKNKIHTKNIKYKQINQKKCNELNKGYWKKIFKNTKRPITNKQWVRCKDFFENKCAYCDSNIDITKDLFIPSALGGSYEKNNIVPACNSCNSSKKDKQIMEWYPFQKFYSEFKLAKIYKYLGGNENEQM